jgi:hypothetical protein
MKTNWKFIAKYFFPKIYITIIVKGPYQLNKLSNTQNNGVKYMIY